MDVVVDGERNFTLTRNPESVLAAVAAVDEYLRERGRAILSVKVDGKSVPYTDLVDTLGDKPVDQVEQLVVDSAEMAALVRTTLEELHNAAPELPQACRHLAEVFQGESPDAGFEPFQQLAAIWAHVKSREICVANALNVPLDELQLDGVSLAQVHRELNDYLNEAAAAIEKRDCVLLADLLEYELAPRAEQETRIAAALEQRAQEATG
ncbi:MAG TPA: hypothetical protein HPP77_00675 [Candidatus Hydrogenedentes bacterium]|nr:hypothetical protein [Candidatus Hydrogenedentota bacterium]HIJ72978.1 hypothetical protein [Candidatus Hydrogenedentota bacterium]